MLDNRGAWLREANGQHRHKRITPFTLRGYASPVAPTPDAWHPHTDPGFHMADIRPA
ncbi:hypothetical protein [Streptomyces bohaiensis]|uniref:Uncharacterized protein n=1 Tax=Streptomyces bohaiensis TaxID=1431344 RepID=A0ABX1CEN9_9ACTN|nr:hypothetical protein [Streptomyces bohaiensis]NJQ15669.1 hypothetical protein [Streptomyces bohaiensis]